MHAAFDNVTLPPCISDVFEFILHRHVNVTWEGKS